MSAGSEQISTKWIAGLERVCRDCHKPITNLQDVGQYHRHRVNGKDVGGWIRCVGCLLARREAA